MSNSVAPEVAQEAVLVQSSPIPAGTPVIQGHDFNKGCEIDQIMKSMLTTGFQASYLGKAVDEVNRMLTWRLSDEEVTEETDEEFRDMSLRCQIRTKIFLGFTSNLVSAGTREQIRFLAQHSMVDVIVTTAGGIEEDLIKCLGDSYLGDFSMVGADLRKKGLNRAGNVLIPNTNYCKFEDWIIPILDKMLEEQNNCDVNWTPSKIIDRLGREINDERSIYYWTSKNSIRVFCPGLTDGSIGDMLYFHSYRNPGLKIDLVEDIRRINDEAVRAKPRKTGCIILGGGVPKHHINNANLMRNGTDFSVYINTAQEFDGSDSGARPDEAVSWGKIKVEATPVKVSGDATIIFPLLISQTFYKEMQNKKSDAQNKTNHNT